jgi:hypothetical protein
MSQRDDDTDDDLDPMVFTAGLFRTANSLIHTLFDHSWANSSQADKFRQGIHRLLRLFVDWIRERCAHDSPAFVLGQSYYDIQNIQAAENGILRAVIDWDAVSAGPRMMAPEGYPGWPTRGWDPVRLGYPTSEKEKPVEELTHYRGEHLRTVRMLKVVVTLTRQSLVVRNVYIAACNSVYTCTPCTRIYGGMPVSPRHL